MKPFSAVWDSKLGMTVLVENCQPNNIVTSLVFVKISHVLSMSPHSNKESVKEDNGFFFLVFGLD